jgi:putative nucleotidyltransferase with HDIG domain
LLRQDEARRRAGEVEIPLRDRLHRLLTWPLVIAVGFWAAASMTLLTGSQRLPYYLGQDLKQPVLSRINFERINEGRTAEARKASQQEVPNYYRINQALVDGILAEFRDLFAAANAAESYEAFSAGLPGSGINPSLRWGVDEQGFKSLKALGNEAGAADFKRDIDTAGKRLIQKNLVLRSEEDREIRSTAGSVELDRGNGAFEAVPKEKLIYSVNSEHVERLAQDIVRQIFSVEIRQTLASIIKRAINPTEKKAISLYVFDANYTRAIMDRAASLDPVKDAFQAGDRLVGAGILDSGELALLKAEHEQYLVQRDSNPDLRAAWREEQSGVIGLIGLITVGMVLYTLRCQPRIARKWPRALALAMLLLMMLIGDRLVLSGVGASPIWSVATITMTAAILTLAYSQIFAIGMTCALALITIMTEEVPDGQLVVFLSVSAAVVLLLDEIRTRLRMVEVGGVAALVAAVSTAFLGFMESESLPFIVKESTFAALAALGGTSIVLVLLPIIEKVFRVTTNLTLLEWADASNPLLRQLIERAPGTWQHSHLLGSMAETAAEEIGANGLLARVGAYYHDIGKMCKPNYFVENQSSRENAHRNLAPTMSLLVILAHVKDGLALAKEHGLPPALHQFILEHHGTTVVRYFHAMAAKEARSGRRDEREADETEFRYPGPKPHSRESAILMLCDGVEGAVRALADPTAGRIESVVHEIMIARLMDGQFDDCDITLRDLATVEESLIRSLRAIHHGRIAYPKEEEEPEPVTVRSA